MDFWDSETFWGRVKEKARINGLTIKALSERIGEPYKSITNRITNGTVPKKKGLVEAIANELGCSVVYLMTGQEDESNKKYSRDIEYVIETYKHLSEDKKSTVRLLLKALEAQQEREHEQFKREHPDMFPV